METANKGLQLKEASKNRESLEIIESAHKKICGLRKEEDRIYEDLLSELGWEDDIGLWLFDYLFNANEGESPVEYLKKMGFIK